jgi:leucyl aminopeptidase
MEICYYIFRLILGVYVLIGVNDNKMYSNLLVFKFKNFELKFSDDVYDITRFSASTGDFKELEVINTLGKSDYKRIIIVGLGLTEEFNSIRLFKALGNSIRSLKNSIEDLDILDNFEEDFGYIIGQSLQLSLYKYYGIRKKEEKVKLQKINIISQYRESLSRGLIVGNSINFAREISNMPSNYVTPKYIAQQAEEIAKDEKLDIQILDKYMLEQLGMNGILYVGKGSIHSPRLIVLQYFGDSESSKIISLIGKGVTFDSGGISLKPSKNMENMVTDMSGAADILAVMKAIGKLRPKKNIIALIPVVENMLSGNSYKPGDVITTYSGKTVQVISTDAEGRLILCDAITYAKELGATSIIDVATLTGSCANFLGGINIGLSSNSDEFSQKIIKCGDMVGENIWKLPSNPEYMEQLKTDSADLRNTGSNCGAVVSGLFLQNFAEEVTFAHLDIAGTSSYTKPIDAYDTGSNGIPVRTLLQLLME